jgi:hypothetical protein
MKNNKLTNVKVLVAEDMLSINFNKMILEDFGLECDIAENGKLLSKTSKQHL